jgi:Zn-dependent protease with chaperone function
MKLSPRDPVDGINSPPATTWRDILGLVVGAVIVVGLFFLAVSWAVDAVVERMDPETETELFAELVPTMLESFAEGGWDEAAEAALAPVFARIRDAAPALPYDFTVRVSCMGEPNALALPGGAVVVTAGLLRMLETEEELAFVLGHELGHFVGRDHLRGIGRAAVLQLGFGMMFFATGVDPTVAVQIALEAFSSAHSREQEVLADAIGAAVLAAMTEGDVSGAERALNALSTLDGGLVDEIDFLRSHPVGARRRDALSELTVARGWRVLRQRGTPLAPALRSACAQPTEEAL